MADLPDVLNWRRWSDLISLSGQPSETQMEQIANLGVTHIVNLGPHSNKGALDDEAACVTALGLEYIYIPVDFENPTEADYTAFCAALKRLEGKAVHVHCIYNARVSAFFFRYAQSGHAPNAKAFSLMDGIWRPGGVWAAFIGKPQDCDQPNRYAGYDYHLAE
ncbi:MAG: protein tyrosine phosphatase family protein [Sulfitobacter sp.]